MEASIIVQNVMDQLNILTGIEAYWDPEGPTELDGRIHLSYNEKSYAINIEVKRELRHYQLPALVASNDKYPPLVVVAENIFPSIKEELRQQGIGYLETNGNMFFKWEDLFLWIDGRKAFPMEKSKVGRAFTKTGLRVVFHFLLNDEIINLTYREIAKRTGVGFGNINFVMMDLKEQGYLLPVNKDEYKLVNKKKLLHKWMDIYAEKLKPDLLVETFRFLKDEDFLNWRQIPLDKTKTWWGSEPAADILTNYLKPEELTLYTLESRNELIKHYRLIPDKEGKVKAYQKFWLSDEVNDSIVPPLLIYVDLVNTGDRRCIETAQKVYNALLQDKF